jgi:hypothetical protein
MPTPQSSSVVHVAAAHQLIVEAPASTAGAGSVTGHAVLTGHATLAGSGSSVGSVSVMHVKPFPQSVSPQGTAWARGEATNATARHPVAASNVENDMSAPFGKRREGRSSSSEHGVCQPSVGRGSTRTHGLGGARNQIPDARATGDSPS